MFRRKLEGMDTPGGAERLREILNDAEAVIIGAGAGLSTSAGYTYSGERFDKYFYDFRDKYGIKDIYSGGFYPFPDEKIMWAWWSRHIWVNRYVPIPKDVYEKLLSLVREKDYFVITTNVDHCFQRAGFDKRRIFYTQGDYGLWQCSKPCHNKTYDNYEPVRKMILSQGFEIGDRGELSVPEGTGLKMEVPAELLPRCPVCGRPMTMNLRSDDTFVEDEGWNEAAERYSEFLKAHMGKKTLFLELAVGMNTPGIIKYPFWRMTSEWPEAHYACLNFGEAYAPEEIREKSICLNGDIGEMLDRIAAK